MRYHVLAADYDGTLARHGHVSSTTIEALARLKRSGRRLVLVTGRQLPDLLQVFPDIALCERVVAENGAILYRPDTREEVLLAEPPPHAFVNDLIARKLPVTPGRVVVATHQPHEAAVLEAIRDLGLELQLVFNKGAVMVLPSGVNKATGLRAALTELGISEHNAVAIGDAENDHAFMAACECAVAVQNALPVIRHYADWVTPRDHGDGVADLIDRLLASDLGELRLERHQILVGSKHDGGDVRLPPYGINVLLSGTSGAGKSTFATAFAEQLSEHHYQYCIIDPEGDYEHLNGAVVLGDAGRPPSLEEAIELLDDPGRNVVINLLGIGREHRPQFFAHLLPALVDMRVRCGRPHWVLIDETHHLMPSTWEQADATLPQALHGLMLITVHPDHVSRAVLSAIDTVIAIGSEPQHTLNMFAQTLGMKSIVFSPAQLAPGEVLAWWPHRNTEPCRFRTVAPRSERRRHLRKYAEGDLGEDHSFYFRGRSGQLNLRAQNLILFLQIAQGIDDDTWLHHLRRNDYSRWFQEAIKDDKLAAAAAEIESSPGISAAESRARIRAEVEKRYIMPA